MIGSLKKARAKLGVALVKACQRGFWRRSLLRLRIRFLSTERPRRFPIRIQIEATNKCNLRCPCCSHSRESRAGEHLSPETLEQILRRLSPTPRRVVLSGIGEPLLNPSFFPMVDLLAQRGIRCEFYTNGTMLTPPAQQAILSRANIAMVNISCDGATKETFESLRLGADFERWQRLVRQFLADARQQRGPTLSVGANVVLCRENLAEIGEIMRLLAGLGFGHVYLMHPIPVDDTAAALCASPAELAAASEAEMVRLGRTLGLAVTCSFQRSGSAGSVFPRCTQPWEYIFVRVNGDVAPCCALFGSDRAEVMGNLLEQDFATIWHGDRFRSYRRSNADGTNALCRVCPYY
jgi:radical SAM protein with 4Fe4S-binding SPASM domain